MTLYGRRVACETEATSSARQWVNSRDREGEKENRGKVEGSSPDTTTNRLCDLGHVSSSLGLWSLEL